MCRGQPRAAECGRETPARRAPVPNRARLAQGRAGGAEPWLRKKYANASTPKDRRFGWRNLRGFLNLILLKK